MKPVHSIFLLLSLHSAIAVSPDPAYKTDYQKSLEERKKKYPYKKASAVTKITVYNKKGTVGEMVVMVEGECRPGEKDPWLFPVTGEVKDGVLELELVVLEGNPPKDSTAKTSETISASFRIEPEMKEVQEIRVVAESNQISFKLAKASP